MTNSNFIKPICEEFYREIFQKTDKSIHFIGLGGIGMSGLARFLLELGYKVSGSDIKDSPTLKELSKLGAKVFITHSSENIFNVAAIVASSAIKKDNPEIKEALKNNLPILHRSQVLNALMDGYCTDFKPISIGVAGTHGKTTTSGMIALLFEDAGLDPSFAVGGKMPHLKTNSKLGKGNHFISELDESDGTIKYYAPDISVVTNLEYDHPDHYVNGFEQILETFENYVNRLNSEAKIIINVDCEGNRQLIERIKDKKVIKYSINGMNNDISDYSAKEITIKGLNSRAKIYKNNEFIGEITLPIPGVHNISNALACLISGLESGIEFEKIVASLSRFTGMKRRFQLVGEINNSKIIDDYAHHPTEISTTLDAARKAVLSMGKGKVVAIFQPHRYSRLSNLWSDFTECFNNADEVYICDVYSAGEDTISNISSERLAKEIKHKNVEYLKGSMEDISKSFIQKIKPDSIILTMGAGDITGLGNLMIENVELGRK